MRDYVIITDSCCSLNAQEVSELEITVLPLSFSMNNETFLDTPDHHDMDPKEFFARIQAGGNCITAAVNIQQYKDAMQPLLEAGKDILCICFSGALSSTYQSAYVAADEMSDEFPEAKIIVIDSLCACRGLGMLIYRSVMYRRQTNADIETLAKFVTEQREHQDHWFIVDDLNHLHRGGRVSKATAVAGTLLNIKPVMHCDANGELTAVSSARGVKKALQALVQKMDELGIEPDQNQPVFICHADCPDYVAYISELLRNKFGITDIRPDYICPVIGAHTGIGTLGLFFVGKER